MGLNQHEEAPLLLAPQILSETPPDALANRIRIGSKNRAGRTDRVTPGQL